MSEQRYLAEAIEAGAAGVMHKSAPMSDLVEAVRRLAAGEQLLSQQEVIEALRFIGRERESNREAQLAIDKLTPREREVLQALAEGWSDKEIATAASRRRGNGTLPRDKHPLQARGFLETASARLRRAPRFGNDRVILEAEGPGKPELPDYCEALELRAYGIDRRCGSVNEAARSTWAISIYYMMLTRGSKEGDIVQGNRGTEGRAPMLVLAGVLLLLIAAETAREMADVEPGASVVSNLGYAVAEAILDVYLVTAVALVMGVMVYLLAYLRGGRITFLDAIFNWAVVVAAAVAALFAYLQ